MSSSDQFPEEPSPDSTTPPEGYPVRGPEVTPPSADPAAFPPPVFQPYWGPPTTPPLWAPPPSTFASVLAGPQTGQTSSFKPRKLVLLLSAGYISLCILFGLLGLARSFAPTTCEGVKDAPGYSDVVSHGWVFKCVTTIDDVDTSNPDQGVAVGLTDDSTHIIQIRSSHYSVTSVAAHEIAHALAWTYYSPAAQSYYDKAVGLSFWQSMNNDNYFKQGTESFAESYAKCSLGDAYVNDNSGYVLAPCEVVDKTLSLMRSAGPSVIY